MYIHKQIYKISPTDTNAPNCPILQRMQAYLQKEKNTSSPKTISLIECLYSPTSPQKTTLCNGKLEKIKKVTSLHPMIQHKAFSDGSVLYTSDPPPTH